MTDQRQQIFYEAKITPAKEEDFQGKEWDVTIIGAADGPVTVGGQEYIKSKNGRLYSINAVKESAPQWDGVKVYDNHLTQTEFEQKQGMRSPVKEWLGTIVKPYWSEADSQLRGTFKVVEDTLAGKLKSAWEQGVLSSIGLSIDTFPITNKSAMHEGQQMPVIEGFKKILSVDLVGDPAAGGGFNRILASTIQEDSQMDESKVRELIQAEIGPMVHTALAEALAAEAEELEADEATTEAEDEAPDGDNAQEMKMGKGKKYGKKGKKGKMDDEEDEDEMMEADEDETEADSKASEAMRRTQLLESRIALTDALTAAKLPEAYAAPIKRMFEGKIIDKQELDAVIDAQKKAQAAADPNGRVTEAGGQRGDITPGLNEEDKVQLEVMRLIMGNREFGQLEHSDTDFVQERVKESAVYKSWLNSGKDTSGNYRRMSELLYDYLGGNPMVDPRLYEATTTSTLATAVKNTVNIMLAADYSKQDRWYEQLVTVEEVDTIDDSTLARLYGLDELPVVEEGAAYTEEQLQDEEETASFVKRGRFVSITMETLMKDKLNVVRTIPRRQANAWYNTLSSLTANVFTLNTAAGPVLSDTGALFNATAATSAGGHANLLTAALSFAAYSAARTAMRKQTDQPLGDGRRLQINPRFMLVPEDLEITALQIRNSEQLPGSANNDINPFYQNFDVITVPDWTDVSDWALVGDPGRFPAIFHIFPRGQRVPRLFTADSDVAGTMFTNDTIRFKVQMLTYRFSSTYDCAPVADFRPLHKNNV